MPPLMEWAGFISPIHLISECRSSVRTEYFYRKLGALARHSANFPDRRALRSIGRIISTWLIHFMILFRSSIHPESFSSISGSRGWSRDFSGFLPGLLLIDKDEFMSPIHTINGFRCFNCWRDRTFLLIRQVKGGRLVFFAPKRFSY